MTRSSWDGRLGLGAVLAITAHLACAEMSSPAPPPALPDLMQGVASLALVLAAIVALPWLLRRVMRLPTAVGGQLRVLAALAVGPRERVVLVQVGSEQLLLGVVPGQVRLLHVLAEAITGDEIAHNDLATRDRGRGTRDEVASPPPAPNPSPLAAKGD